MDRDQGWALVAAMERAAEATVWAAAYARASDPSRENGYVTPSEQAEATLGVWRRARKAEDDAREAQREANLKELEDAMANARGEP